MNRLDGFFTPVRAVATLIALCSAAICPAQTAVLKAELAIAPFGGMPFTIDLDHDGASEILWLQSPGLFHSRVFDKPPWNTFVTPEERDHFCLTATRANGEILWQVGAPGGGGLVGLDHD